jgi:hypothetical protein
MSKARLCVRIDSGSETFVPVVNWNTVRFLLVMSILVGLETRQVDYVAAFVQADIDILSSARCREALLNQVKCSNPKSHCMV